MCVLRTAFGKRASFGLIQPKAHSPIFFRSNNCDYDVDTGCYVFRLPELGKVPEVMREVHIPERFIVGLASKELEGGEQYSRIGKVEFPIDDSDAAV